MASGTTPLGPKTLLLKFKLFERGPLAGEFRSARGLESTFNCLGNLLGHLVALPVAMVRLTPMQQGKKCLAKRFGQQVSQTGGVGENISYIDVATLSVYQL